MTQRPLFDPSKVQPPRAHERPPPAPPPIAGAISVSRLTELVRSAIARGVPEKVQVLGEIGDLSRPASGHVYFTLKDERCELRCVMWRSSAARLKFELETGMEVVATGGVEVYPPRGSYQLIVQKLEPRGVGALELAFRQLRERLEREGLFESNKKRPLPSVPFRVALVTSPSGAAIRDILRTFARRFPVMDVLVYPVRVQGDGAAREISAAIAALNRAAGELNGIDAIILARGGGSLEDLWAFNEEVVARAVAASRIPVVSGVGHEVDVTICDLVADVRAATPTAAAELTTPVLSELLDALQQSAARALRVASHNMGMARARLDTISASACIARPLARPREQAQRIDEYQQRLRASFEARLRRAREHVSAREAGLLRGVSPERFARLGRKLDGAAYQLRWTLGRLLLDRERGLGRLTARLEHRAPQHRVRRLREQLAHARARLAIAARTLLQRSHRELLARLEAVESRDPRRVLRRGYSITRDARTGRIVKTIESVSDGQRIETELADGRFKSTADDPRQPGLFD